MYARHNKVLSEAGILFNKPEIIQQGGNRKRYKEIIEQNELLFTADLVKEKHLSCAGTIGETYIMPDNIELGIINQALMRMRIYAPINIRYFLLYFDYVIKQEARENSKGSAIKNIPPFEIFKRLILPLPPIEEQARIVQRVDELMGICDQLK